MVEANTYFFIHTYIIVDSSVRKPSINFNYKFDTYGGACISIYMCLSNNLTKRYGEEG